MKTKILVSLFIILTVCLVCFHVFAASDEANALDIIAKMKAHQSLIKDMQADTNTTVISNITMPGMVSKGPQTMVQTGHIWQKGTDKSKTEITSPTKQITITNGNLMTIISPDTGQKMTQDLSKGLGSRAQGLDSTKALDYFDLTVSSSATGEYVISGRPKEANKFLGRMDFFIDMNKFIPVRVAMYTPQGSLMSLSEMEYEGVNISSSETVYVPKKIKSIVTMQMGSINTEMVYENVKVNQGINDEVFNAE